MNKNIDDAKRKYVEQYGSALVTNSYLRIALLGVSIALVGSLGLTFWMFSWAKNQKPLVVRIDEVGRATPVSYASFTYTPASHELRYFLAQFSQHHFSRLLGSAEERFGKSLYFLDAKLSQAVIDSERKSESIATFVRIPANPITIPD